MRRIFFAVVITFVAEIATYAQTSPISHPEACKRFSKSVVQVDTAVMRGTGFVADSDGYIVTAFHIVADMQTMRSYANLTVTFEDGPSVPR